MRPEQYQAAGISPDKTYHAHTPGAVSVCGTCLRPLFRAFLSSQDRHGDDKARGPRAPAKGRGVSCNLRSPRRCMYVARIERLPCAEAQRRQQAQRCVSVVKGELSLTIPTLENIHTYPEIHMCHTVSGTSSLTAAGPRSVPSPAPPPLPRITPMMLSPRTRRGSPAVGSRKSRPPPPSLTTPAFFRPARYARKDLRACVSCREGSRAVRVMCHGRGRDRWIDGGAACRWSDCTVFASPCW